MKNNIYVITNDKISEDDKGNLFGPNNDLDNILNSLKLNDINYYLVPVDPNPPEPRAVPSSVSTSFILAFIRGHKTICAILKPF